MTSAPVAAEPAELAAIVTSDLVALCRGRAFPVRDLPRRLTEGVGWVPANLALTPFGVISDENPFGSVGDLRLVPDAATETPMPAGDGAPPLRVFLADITHTDGAAWECCPRGRLRDAVMDLEAETGLHLRASFEHEFTLQPKAQELSGRPFGLQQLLAFEPLGSALVQACEGAGLEPETWLPEYGPSQWELTLSPADALAAADRAILFREIVREVARRFGSQARFTPMPALGSAGNGVHIHLSLHQADGTPATYDASRPGRLSEQAGSFAAGILAHAEAITALTAPSVVSWLRLGPHHWSSAAVFLGERNREALLRICPVLGRSSANHAAQLNIEYRAADATANPWLALAALIRAGLAGIRQQLPAPRVIDVDLDRLPDTERTELGIRPLPDSLANALAYLEKDSVVTEWMPPQLLATYLAVKRSELTLAGKLAPTEQCARYADVY